MDKTTLLRARIAWLSPAQEDLIKFAPSFAAAGYALCDGEKSGRVDIAVVDFRTRRVTAKHAEELAGLARRAAPDCGVVYLGTTLMSAAERAHLRRSGDLVLIEESIKPAIEACRHRLRLRNIAEESGERLKSVAASTRLSEFPPITTSNAPPSVLIAGAPGAAAIAAIDAAEKIAERTIAVFSAGQAMRALETGDFDCAVFAPSAEGDPLIGLARTLRRHHRFQNIPIIGTARDSAVRMRIAAAHGADFLPAEHITDDLGARLVSAARRARLIGAMRRFLVATAGDGIRDRTSGAFSPQFFAQHVERLFLRADHSGRTSSIIGVRLQALDTNEDSSCSSRTLADAVKMMRRVTRAEDCIGRLTSNTFLIVMSATNGADAQIAARRIEGVISNTMFRSRSMQDLFAVATATAAAERPTGEFLEETIARVLASLNQTPMRTAER